MVEKKLKTICLELIKGLEEREKEIIVRRFGLARKERETLQAIGDSLGITRERVRQIEFGALEKIKKKINQYKEIFDSIDNYFKEWGGLRKEETLLAELGKKEKNEFFFILNLNEGLKRVNQTEEFFSFWFQDTDVLKKAKKIINTVFINFKRQKKLKTLEELAGELGIEKKHLASYLEISKKIQKNKKGFYGLKDWPEINPRRVGDRAYLIFKEIQRPLHFSEVAKLMKNANLQTVHNELIKDERFVLVGRGIYALKEWGYWPGEVKDVILKILREEKRPLTKEEILEKVKKQRIVKENTVLVNLTNKKYFEKDEFGRYRIKTAQI